MTTQMKIRRYRPGVSHYSKRRSDEEWEQHRQLLTQMHEQHYTRRQMVQALRDCDFDITSGQLLAQLKKWDLMVYGPGNRGASRIDSFCETSPPNEDSSSHTEQPAAATQSEADSTPQMDDLHDAGFMGNLCLVSPEPEPEPSEAADDWLDSASTLITAQSEPSEPSLPQLADHNDTENNLDEEDIPVLTLASDSADATLAESMASAQSIIQQLPTIMEPWSETFPTACCCQSFFSCSDRFAKSPELYQLVMQQSSYSKLKYTMALLHLAEIRSKGGPRLELQEPLWLSITYYVKLCTRFNHKNSLASSILHSLLRAWEINFEGQLPFPAEFSTKRKADSPSALCAKLFKAKAKNRLQKSQALNFDWDAASEYDMGVLLGFAARRPSTFPLINWNGQIFGSSETWSTEDEPCKEIDIVETAQAFAKYMEEQWSSEQNTDKAVGAVTKAIEYLGDCNLHLVFHALGLMLALELSSYAGELMKLKGRLSVPKSWSRELRHFIDTTIKTLSLNAEYAEKFRKSYWLISTEKIGHNGKSIHFGSCKAKAEWETLERNIHDFDEERTWIERRLFSGRNSWPQTEDLMVSDNMSIRSTSSINSFRRFQALAFHLKIGTPNSRSIRSKSTKSAMSKMSLDSHLSWQLEHMLGIQEEKQPSEGFNDQPEEGTGTHENQKESADVHTEKGKEPRLSLAELTADLKA